MELAPRRRIDEEVNSVVGEEDHARNGACGVVGSGAG
jgi:hypothetical protein